MATFAFTNASVKVNAVDMSAMCKKATIKTSAAELDDTAFGDTFHSRLGGLKDYSVDLDFNQDFAAAQVDVTLWPILGTVVAFEIKADGAAPSATNPRYVGTILIKEYSPLDGNVGDLGHAAVSWPGASTLFRYTT